MPQTDWLQKLHSADYKQANLESWKRNKEYWFSEPLRHIVDNDAAIDTAITTLVKPGFTVIDMGCGDGFLFERIAQRISNFRYIGLDFNSSFIDELSSKYRADERAEFIKCDFEKEVPQSLVGSADVVFSFFVLLEIENMAACYRFADELLKEQGCFSVWTIEYVFLILAVSRNMRDFKKNLKIYEDIRASGGVPFTFQKIDLGEGESRDLAYGSVFHSTADFISIGLAQDWKLTKISENIQTKKFHPKVYQNFEFRK